MQGQCQSSMVGLVSVQVIYYLMFTSQKATSNERIKRPLAGGFEAEVVVFNHHRPAALELPLLLC
jgi:hypothetical protein